MEKRRGGENEKGKWQVEGKKGEEEKRERENGKRADHGGATGVPLSATTTGENEGKTDTGTEVEKKVEVKVEENEVEDSQMRAEPQPALKPFQPPQTLHTPIHTLSIPTPFQSPPAIIPFQPPPHLTSSPYIPYSLPPAPIAPTAYLQPLAVPTPPAGVAFTKGKCEVSIMKDLTPS
ncbi:hypothetical protein Pmani_025818 [Petrolisthes manimaculis]|uniref:Uncharacterized protein n=1 Tax=Petrolisthes manimaculis TaxID=1843537 RepID=A0AAE1U0S7_9EUCA|nr:hypothetical protein Pmani_025818 [Petrolisthes manimaculis]